MNFVTLFLNRQTNCVKMRRVASINVMRMSPEKFANHLFAKQNMDNRQSKVLLKNVQSFKNVRTSQKE